MLIEEEIISQTVRVRCNKIPFLISIDYANIANTKITRVSDGSEGIPYYKLIIDREMWEAAKDLKEYIDGKFNLLPVESDRVKIKRKGVEVSNGNDAKMLIIERERKPYHFHPRACANCDAIFTPKTSRDKHCLNCKVL